LSYKIYKITDNRSAVRSQLRAACRRALVSIGEAIVANAKAICPVGTPESTGKPGYVGGTLRDSITSEVSGGGLTWPSLRVGSAVEYAPYVELGTGPYFEPPPEWEQFTTVKGSGVGSGYVTARPFLRPAVEDHKEQYKTMAETELKGDLTL
jgi:HK97 gp10 family phage protein